MIYVAKPRAKIPAAWKARARTERLAILAHYESGTPPAKKFAFKAYRDKAVRKALDEIFHYKCAYCEFSYGGGYSSHIDHWRPKGAVLMADKTRLASGYYWLGADWDNLFPTCQHCNTINTHEFLDQPKPSTGGKLDQFPLALPHRRPPRRGDERRETPLLLNPSRDNPARHLLFPTERTKVGMIAARPDARGRASPKGTQSILVYVLHRKLLVNIRQSQGLLVLSQLQKLRITADRMLASPQDPVHRAYFREQVETLRDNWLQAERPFLAMTYALVRPVVDELSRKPRLRPLLKPLEDLLP